MNMQLAKDLGFLGINVDSGFDLAWMKTEVADKIAKGDKMGVYKLVNFARHSEDEAVRDYAYKLMQVYKFEIDDYDGTAEKEDEKPFDGDKAETAEEVIDDINAAIEAGEDIKIEIVKDIDLTSGSIKGFTIPEGAKAEFRLDEGVTLTAKSGAFDVKDGAELILSGKGTIKETSKTTNATVYAAGGSKVVIDGITLDCYSEHGGVGNYAYGVYAQGGSVVEMKSGCIKVGQGSALSSNGTTGRADFIVSGGELLSDGAYAIYMPSWGVTTITGGTVQGINVRMGQVNISGNAKIIPTTITDDTCDPIGSNINTSGCCWFGDTIVLESGTYDIGDNRDIELNIGGNVTVKSGYRAALSVYSVDTKTDANVTVTMDDSVTLETTDSAFSAIEVYDHAYIADEAQKAGKSYNPGFNSTIKITKGDEIIYPVVDSGTVVAPEGPVMEEEF